MEKRRDSIITKKTIYFIVGAFLIVGTLTGGNLGYIMNWSTAELVGYNTWTLVSIFGGSYLIYRGVRR